MLGCQTAGSPTYLNVIVFLSHVKERARNNLSKFMLRQAQHERWWRLSCSSYFMRVPKLIAYICNTKQNQADWLAATLF